MADPHTPQPTTIPDTTLDGVVGGVISPRDPASGLPTGRRIEAAQGFVAGSDDSDRN
jgi:hypothetical protein